MFSPGSLFNIFRRKEKREGVQFSFTDHLKKLEKEARLRPGAPKDPQKPEEYPQGPIHENPEMAKKQFEQQLAWMKKFNRPIGAWSVKTLLRKFPRIKIG